jgi:uncharacterized protein (TIGR03083 family)
MRTTEGAAVRVSEINPIDRAEAAAIAPVELARVVDLFRSLTPDDWARPTANTGWDVRATAGHMVGMLETFSSKISLIRDMVSSTRATPKDGLLIDTLTAKQVERNASLSTAELIAKTVALAPKQARWRAAQRLLRRGPLKQPMPDGTVETWSMGWLFDVVLTRDPWMHRTDIAAATGTPMALTAEHDGRIVADAVRDWAGRHGQPFELTLTGPAGGTFVQGSGGEAITVDAVEFCRAVSGRGDRPGLLATDVPF